MSSIPKRRRIDDDESDVESNVTPPNDESIQDNSEDESKNTPSQDAKNKRRRERLLAEVNELREQQMTLFPSDEIYNDMNRTTAVEDDYEQDDDDSDSNADYAPDEAEEGMSFQEDGPEDEEEDEGEDLLENAFQDYQRIEALDTYGTEGIDDREYDLMDVNERAAADAEIDKRRAEEMKRAGDKGRSGLFLRRFI